MRASNRDEELSAEKTIASARGQLDKAIARLSDKSTSDLDEVVHDVRKRIKKVRALLKMARGAIGRKSIAKVDHRLRDAARPLASVRDASALLLALDKLTEGSVGLVPTEAFGEARAALVEHHTGLLSNELVEGSALSRSRNAIRQARRKMARWHRDEGRFEPFSGLKAAYKRGRAAFEAALEDPTPERLHELRKQVKTFLYQIRFLGKHPAGSLVRIRNLASLLADELGEGHDLDVLRSFLDRLECSGPIMAALDRRRLDLRWRSLQRAGVIFLDKPRRFVKSLKSSTEAIEFAQVDR